MGSQHFLGEASRERRGNSDRTNTPILRVASKSMSDIHKSRQRIGGRKIDNPDEYKKAIKQAILDRIEKGIYSPQTIGEQLGKDRSTIYRFIQELAADGKIKLGETGRVEKVEALVEQRSYESLESDAFVQRYPSVKKWVDDMQTRLDGKPLSEWQQNLAAVKKVCDLLKVTPELLISSKESVEQFTRAFMLEFRKVSKNSPHLYVMALRNLAMSNGIIWPRGAGGLMSGKKIAFGQYAHIKISDKQIMQGIEIGQSIHQDVGDWFAIATETAARHGAMHRIDISSIEQHADYLTLRAYESKTNKTWTKYIVNPRIQQIVTRRAAARSASGRTDLFLNGKSEKEFGAWINAQLKEVYRRLGLTERYFFNHPTHALRHIGAHHWLRLTNYNYSLVAKIGGWEDENTLKKCYGEMPAEVVISELHKARSQM